MPTDTPSWKWGVLMTLRFTKERGLPKDTPQPHIQTNPGWGAQDATPKVSKATRRLCWIGWDKEAAPLGLVRLGSQGPIRGSRLTLGTVS